VRGADRRRRAVRQPRQSAPIVGKIPTLVLDDGTALYDSRVISSSSTASRRSAAFDTARIPRDRVAVRRWEALADGVSDAGLLWRYESMRDKKEQSKGWQEQAARAHEARHGADGEGDRRGLLPRRALFRWRHRRRLLPRWLDFRKPGPAWTGAASMLRSPGTTTR